MAAETITDKNVLLAQTFGWTVEEVERWQPYGYPFTGYHLLDPQGNAFEGKRYSHEDDCYVDEETAWAAVPDFYHDLNACFRALYVISPKCRIIIMPVNLHQPLIGVQIYKGQRNSLYSASDVNEAFAQALYHFARQPQELENQ